MSDTRKKMMQWLDEGGTLLNTPGTLVLAESTHETFDAHSANISKHLTAPEKAALKYMKQIRVAQNLAERDAIPEPFEGLSVFVKDASGDASVTSGGAYYIYNGTAWLKTADSESMDVVLHWANIEGKPLTDAELVDITTRKHTHANADSLNKLTVDADGLKVDGVGVGGIAIVTSIAATPVYNGRVRLLVTDSALPVA